MVEVFKTNILKLKNAKKITGKLISYYPDHKINFDLTDCDHILRVEGRDLLPVRIQELVKEEGFDCEILI